MAREAGVEKYEVCPEGVVLAELKAARLKGACMLCFGAPDYPEQLMDLADAPPILWAVGNTDILTRDMIALVGARNASSLGTRMAKTLAKGLGDAGYVVTSGLARGIDTAAHHSALSTGTVAVLAGGVDVLYPSENTRLAEEIVEHGGLRLSEMPMGLQPVARHFPMRNRIISGLCGATVVVEAAAKSGSLITAKNALDQGREVLAVPGHPLDARASGCNMLIRDGARLVRNVDDIVEALPMREAPRQLDLGFDAAPAIPSAPPEKRTLAQTANLHSQILSRLGPSPLAEDQLIRDLGTQPHALSPALTELELDGRIQRHSGGLLSLIPDRAR